MKPKDSTAALIAVHDLVLVVIGVVSLLWGFNFQAILGARRRPQLYRHYVAALPRVRWQERQTAAPHLTGSEQCGHSIYGDPSAFGLLASLR